MMHTEARGPERRAPVFIVGLGRSGTTLTAQILDRHSRLSICGESHFLRLTAHRRGHAPLSADEAGAILDRLPMRWTGADPVDVLAEFQGTDHSLRALFDSIMRARMLRHGGTRYGEKTPSHFWYLGRLFEWYPDARIVYLVRDPRRVHASFVRSDFAPGLRAVERWVVPRALYWSYGARQLRRIVRERPTQVFKLHFEDLVADPEASVRALCAFLDEPFEPEMLDVANENSSFSDLADGEGVRTTVLTRPLELPSRTLTTLEVVCGAEMIQQGYAPVRVSPRLVAVLERLGFYAVARALHRAARRLRGRP